MGRIEEHVLAWLEAVERAPESGYIQVEGADWGTAHAESEGWCWDVFQRAASPYNPDLKVRRSFHAATEVTPDLVRHEYALESMPVEVIEGRNFLLLRVPAPPGWEEVTRIARRILAHPWDFKSEGPLQEGASFSSNPEADLMSMGSWEDRADGGIRCGKLYFMCFKRTQQIMGYWAGEQWFEDGFRARLSGK